MLRKGADKGKGKSNGKAGNGELSWGYQAPCGEPLRQVQAAQDQYQNADVSQWLVPIYAVTQTTRDQWSTVKRGGKLAMVLKDDGAKIQHATKFAAFAGDENDSDDFPDFIVAAKTINTGIKMLKWVDKESKKNKKTKSKEAPLTNFDQKHAPLQANRCGPCLVVKFRKKEEVLAH